MASEEAKFSEEISNNIDKQIDQSKALADAESGSFAKNEELLTTAPEEDIPWRTRMWEVFTTFWPLGFVAFGGPQAHIAILRDHLVVQRDWMDEEAFTGELVI
jgi:chromate transporter